MWGKLKAGPASIEAPLASGGFTLISAVDDVCRFESQTARCDSEVAPLTDLKIRRTS
jgi:hypothetical protein